MRGIAFAALAVGALVFSSGSSVAQSVTFGASTITLKNGESTEIGQVFWMVNCRSILKATPEAEVIEGPPEVTVIIKPAMVMNRGDKCPSREPGGILVISAKGIEDPSLSNLNVRINYKTKDGDRQLSRIFNLALYP